MNLEDQVTSLELSKELKRLGVEQDSLFYYVSYSIHENELASREQIDYLNSRNKIESTGCSCCEDEDDIKEKYSAFTSSDLLELLPRKIDANDLYISFNRNRNNARIISDDDDFVVFYASDSYDGIFYETDIISDTSCVNALAKMLIHLIENGLIKNG